MRALKQAIVRLLRSFGYELVKPQEVHSLKEHLQYVFADQDIDCVVDVGAHRGDYGSFLRAAGYAGAIISFEPVEKSFRELVDNSAGDAAWSSHRLALGSRDETREIGVASAPYFSSFRTRTRYAARQFAAETSVEHRDLVEVRRLDSVFVEVVPAGTRRAFLKLDTQGWDLEVLEGASGCLDHIVACQVEVSVRALYDGAPTYLEALAYLSGLGFQLTDAVPIVRDRRHHVIEFDCVFVREAAAR